MPSSSAGAEPHTVPSSSAAFAIPIAAYFNEETLLYGIVTEPRFAPTGPARQLVRAIYLEALAGHQGSAPGSSAEWSEMVCTASSRLHHSADRRLGGSFYSIPTAGMWRSIQATENAEAARRRGCIRTAYLAVSMTDDGTPYFWPLRTTDGTDLGQYTANRYILDIERRVATLDNSVAQSTIDSLYYYNGPETALEYYLSRVKAAAESIFWENDITNIAVDVSFYPGLHAEESTKERQDNLRQLPLVNPDESP